VTDHLRQDLGFQVDLGTGDVTAVVPFPANAVWVEFFIIASIDGDYELPEDVIATLVADQGYFVGQPEDATAMIVDMTADLDISSVGTGTGFLDEDEEDNPGSNIRVDNDYDAAAAWQDFDEYRDAGYGFPTEEDDLQHLRITSHIHASNDAASLSAPESYSLEYDFTSIQVWKLGTVVPGGDYLAWVRFFPGQRITIPANGSLDLMVEGLRSGPGIINLVWHADLPLYVDYGFDTVRYTVWNGDLDIDSDNNNGFSYPDNSAWEEHLEAHTHGLGKLLKIDATHYTPSRLRLNPGLDPTDPDIRIRLQFNITGQSGIIKIWNTFEADPNRDPSSLSVSDGGNRIYPGEYSLAELGYTPQTDGLTLWLEAITVFPGHWDKKGIEVNGKPDDRITSTVLVREDEIYSDEVKYMIIADNSFYDNLQTRPELRHAMASEGVYALEDLPQFALRRLSKAEIEALGGIHPSIAGEFNGQSVISGFDVVLYHDYVSGDFVLTFGGTDDYGDLVANIWQSVGAYTPQYVTAMEIADEFAHNSSIGDSTITTGHSLGGGLASAAAVVGGFHADTFNAAGLSRATLLGPDGTELYSGALNNYDNAQTRIDAYFLDYDILSYVQDKVDLLPDALGFRIRKDGPLDEIIQPLLAASNIPVLLSNAFSDGSNWPAVLSLLGPLGYYMGLCHTTDYYHYGFLVHENAVGAIEWDIHGYGL